MEKLPSGNYRERIRYQDRYGKTKQKSFTGPTKRAVKDAIEEWKIQEKIRQESEPEPGSVTVREALEEYIRLKKPVLSPSTIRGYSQMLFYFGEDCDLAAMDAGKIRSKDLQAFVGVLSLDHSPKTVRNIFNFLKASLELAVPDRSYRVTLPSKQPVKRTVPTDDQVKQLLEAANPEMKKAIVLGSLGLRRGEVCALKQSDLYPDLCLIHIHSDMVQNEFKEWIHKDIPKTSASVRAPREVMQLLCGGSPDDYVVGLKPSSVTWNFTDLRDRLGIDVSFHSLRRYYASVQHALGVPEKYIQQSGGWSSPEVMRRCYEQVLEDKAGGESEKVVNYYRDMLSGQLPEEEKPGRKKKA